MLRFVVGVHFLGSKMISSILIGFVVVVRAKLFLDDYHVCIGDSLCYTFFFCFTYKFARYRMQYMYWLSWWELLLLLLVNDVNLSQSVFINRSIRCDLRVVSSSGYVTRAKQVEFRNETNIKYQTDRMSSTWIFPRVWNV